MRLFIDLEETIIESSDTGILLPDNIAVLKDFVEVFKPESVETFSWGLWTPAEFAKWEKSRQLIQEQWGLEITTQSFNTEEQQLAFLRDLIGKVEQHELVDFCGLLKKELVFEWFVRKNFQEGHFVLIDDRVPDKEIIMGDLRITMRNIKGVA